MGYQTAERLENPRVAKEVCCWVAQMAQHLVDMMAVSMVVHLVHCWVALSGSPWVETMVVC